MHSMVKKTEAAPLIIKIIVLSSIMNVSNNAASAVTKAKHPRTVMKSGEEYISDEPSNENLSSMKSINNKSLYHKVNILTKA